MENFTPVLEIREGFLLDSVQVGIEIEGLYKEFTHKPLEKALHCHCK